MFAMHDKRVIVTGASRGIGLALARGFVEAGARVALVGRDAATLQAAAVGLGERALPCIVDVSIVSGIEPAFAEVATRLGGLDVLVNNAGVEEVCPSREVEEPLWDRIVDTNLKGAFFCARAAAGLMSGGGAILNLCSLTSKVGVPGAVPYGASKSGLVGMTRALATEWAKDGIRVNAIGPGYFRTALTEVFFADEAWRERILAAIPMRRFGRLDDLVGPALFLCSDEAAYVTGQVLYIDGGFLASI
jgi:NAD(P)-dependent dehydrogenase (short-subunit alcohol dehydrogenase family)